MKNKKLSLTINIIFIVLLPFIIYKFTPVINFKFYGLPFYILLWGASNVFLSLNYNNEIPVSGFILTLIGVFFFIILPILITPGIFRSKKYNSLLGIVNESNFKQDLNQIDISKVRLVDRNMAIKLGDKKIGQDTALGSKAKLGDFYIQNVNNELYWVAPLLHTGFFKWLNNKNGTPGYIMVSASNPQDVKLVQATNQKIFLKYQPNSYFNTNLKRHIYFNGFNTIGLTDFTFEIDDNGSPYWVVTKYNKKVGYSGKDATGTIIVDAQTGEIQSYTVEDTPLWVDRIQPENIIRDQLVDWGKYKKGWINSITSQEGVLQPTEGISLVYGVDGNSYWYTGMTSAGADDSTVGFMLINTRTKHANFYKQAGATEYAAMQSAEGKVQEKRYSATFPIMYNVLGLPTYICSLKDKAGLIKLVAMISVEDYSLIGIGETPSEALRAYKSALKNSMNVKSFNSEMNSKKIKGIVTRFNSDIKNGNSYYYLTVNTTDKIFLGTHKVSEKIIITRVGDHVEIEYDESESQIVDISRFNNNSLK